MLEKKYSRREIIKSGSAVLSSMSLLGIPELVQDDKSFLDANRLKHLVLVQLDGGNDALNTVVPFRDEFYVCGRRSTLLREENLLKLNSSLGLHPSLSKLREIYDRGNLSFFLGLGFSDFSSMSHELSNHVWNTLDTDCQQFLLGDGSDKARGADLFWYHRFMCDVEATHCADIGALVGSVNRAQSEFLSRKTNGSEKSKIFVHKLVIPGFDTHDNQMQQHAKSLESVNDVFKSLDTLFAKLDITVLIYSEFGRTIFENASFGTDHGSAGLGILYSTRASGGVFGSYEIEQIDGVYALKSVIDVRDVYKSIARNLETKVLL